MKALIASALIVVAISVPGAGQADEALRREANALFGQLQPHADPASPLAELGREIFWDTRLSIDGKTACSSCHFARDWGADRRQFSPDARGALTSRHSPTIFNSMSQPMLRWLGDRKSGADQAESSMTGSMGFGSKDAGVARLIELQYLPKFAATFPQDAQPVSPANYAGALAAYQATLVTPGPFDRFMAGDDHALDEQQRSGLKSFVAAGCATCHNGANLGGTMLRKFGLVKDYWLETGAAKPDAGRFAVTRKEEDRYVFRVPMLRNVARTAPYFHDGSVERLDQAVRIMGTVQLGQTLDDATVAGIVAFLESLTGNVPENYAPPGRRPDLQEPGPGS